MGIRKFIIATVLAGMALIPATAFGVERSYGTIEAYQALYAPEIRSNKATLNMYLSRNTLEADLAADGFNIITGDSYQINNVSVLNATTLGSSVVSSSLTSLGTIASLVATTADINAGTVDNATIGATTPSSGAFTTISASGLVTFTGGQTRKIHISPKMVGLDPLNPPVETVTIGGTGNRWNVLQFDADGGSTGDDHVAIPWHIPDGYVANSGRLNIIWSCESAETASDTVTFDMTVLAVASGESVDTTTTGVTATTDTQWTGTADLVFTTQMNFEVLDIAVDDMVYIDFFVDESTSMFTDTIDIHGFEIEYESTE